MIDWIEYVEELKSWVWHASKHCQRQIELISLFILLFRSTNNKMMGIVTPPMLTRSIQWVGGLSGWSRASTVATSHHCVVGSSWYLHTVVLDLGLFKLYWGLHTIVLDLLAVLSAVKCNQQWWSLHRKLSVIYVPVPWNPLNMNINTKRADAMEKIIKACFGISMTLLDLHGLLRPKTQSAMVKLALEAFIYQYLPVPWNPLKMNTNTNHADAMEKRWKHVSDIYDFVGS